MSPRRVGFAHGMALCLATLFAVAGCSNLPTEPLSAIQPTSGTGGGPAGPLEAGLLGGGTTSTITKSVVVGLLGGIVSVGDFTVVVPAGALTQTATITVSQPDLAHPVANLSIAPASANGFLLPVVLVANVKRMDPSLLSTACISYYNPTTGQWERVSGSSVSLLNLTVSAPLWHFSTYRVSSGGKAGW